MTIGTAPYSYSLLLLLRTLCHPNRAAHEGAGYTVTYRRPAPSSQGWTRSAHPLMNISHGPRVT